MIGLLLAGTVLGLYRTGAVPTRFSEEKAAAASLPGIVVQLFALKPRG